MQLPLISKTPTKSLNQISINCMYKYSHQIPPKKYMQYMHSEYHQTMYQDYANQFPIQFFSLNTTHLTFLIVWLVEFILLNLLFHSKKVYNFFTRAVDDSKDRAGRKGRECAPSTTEKLKRGDIAAVLRSLEMSFTSKEAEFQESLDENGIFNLFEQKCPSLDEVKEAFDVFDSNRDGFIEAMELQKVLCALGFKEGSKVENCRRMIGVFDENADGRIDFDEFVKFMETSLC